MIAGELGEDWMSTHHAVAELIHGGDATGPLPSSTSTSWGPDALAVALLLTSPPPTT